MLKVKLLPLFLDELSVKGLKDQLNFIVAFLRHPDKLHVVLLQVFSDIFRIFKGWKHQVIDQLIDTVAEGFEPTF